jgi:hypothetical protein
MLSESGGFLPLFLSNVVCLSFHAKSRRFRRAAEARIRALLSTQFFQRPPVLETVMQKEWRLGEKHHFLLGKMGVCGILTALQLTTVSKLFFNHFAKQKVP